MSKFEPGKRYWTRFIGDSQGTFAITVKSRTEKTITTLDGFRFKITTMPHSGIETIKPLGNYSMCPVVSADRVVA